MVKKAEKNELMEWIGKQPELLEKLRRMRAIEEDEGRVDIDRIELEMVELVKGIGAASYQRCLQGKESMAVEQEKSKGGARHGGKKN